MMKTAFIDLEIDGKGRILDIGGVKAGQGFHSARIPEFADFVSDCDCLCGHNIIEHDIKYLKPFLRKEYILIDTLYLSPLLFPQKPYHKLLKDDKILTEELNNPLNDSLKAQSLYDDEVMAFKALDKDFQQLYYDLLNEDIHFSGFFKSIEYVPSRKPFFFRKSTADIFRELFKGKICEHSNVESFVRDHKVECAYAAALISTDDRNSITPAWILHNYPSVENVIRGLRAVNCGDARCRYCSQKLNAEYSLKKWFGYDRFRTFGGEPLQEDAAKAAIKGESLLAIFPTGGGKSLTFQLPALMAGETVRGLTVVISPLQSLMKDQVENLEKKGISEAVYINGLLSPIERRNALERVESGEASLLYIAPEQLRSKTIEKVLMSRTLVRIVIDEAHCFSAWGQDFRIEYMFIGEFIKHLQECKGLDTPIPVSCFTATAKPKVISDICDYFRDRLGITLKRFTTDAARTNLRYTVLFRTSDEDKYQTLRNLLDGTKCPAIVYVTRTKAAEKIAERLGKDGFDAKAFHGQMEVNTKVKAQDDFMSGKVRIIVATSAFGMGVDKSDVGLVVHYEISDSLENYIQEAGRAGRDVNSQAECYVLYNDDDLNKHFILLNQTKLTLSEINQVWSAVKKLTAKHDCIHISALEIARKAGWEEIRDVETKVKSAIAALETAGYLRRGMNSPRIFATSIVPRNMDEASERIERCPDFTEDDKLDARRIIKSLISERSRSRAGTAEAESRVDYLSDMLGIETRKVISIVERMRVAGILAKDDDMTAYLRLGQLRKFKYYIQLEKFLVETVIGECTKFSLKEINEKAIASGIARSSVKDIRTILFFWTIRHYIEKRPVTDDYIQIAAKVSASDLEKQIAVRNSIASFIVYRFKDNNKEEDGEVKVGFSLAGLVGDYNDSALFPEKIDVGMAEEALLFLAKTGILNLEGGFMVLYNKLQIERLKDSKCRYKKDDYHNLDDFYKQRIQQIHIIGKYANMMVSDKNRAMEYVHDYFVLDFKAFIKKYFDSKEEKRIGRNVSERKYNELFGGLTQTQSAIINDNESRFIVVPAGPGSGKTYVLVRKLASLILLEDVKSEQLLMLTFSRAAAVEFKKRLRDLIGNAAEYVEIKTFHSYSFDILGRKGSVDDSGHIVADAVEGILRGRVERSRITKSILVIDEAQDLGVQEFELVKELIRLNDDMRVIAVGDDDQNIYEFRGSDSGNMKSLITDYGASVYDMMENFRSSEAVVSISNNYVKGMSNRLKSAPIICRRSDRGCVRLIHHASLDYEQAIVNEILSGAPGGTVCVLTATNDDALVISALLNKSGRRARLIRSNDGFYLRDLAEFRFFLDTIREFDAACLDNDTWTKSAEMVVEHFRGSECLEMFGNCLEAFNEECPGRKYISDFENFLLESRLEDFSKSRSSEIIVSTIHKSKGCEYDNVYISLKGLGDITDKERRMIYVGMTRAKNNLSVHFSNVNLFLDKSLQRFIIEDNTVYGAPMEVLMQLSHRDVVLDIFKGCQDSLPGLLSGTGLFVSGDYLYAETGGRRVKVLRFSSAFRTQLSRMVSKGYLPVKAKVRFQVFWSYEEPTGETGSPTRSEIMIVLPDLLLAL
ncbi:MAG: RecQ family ATP-dependent DNA helicase [Candidatus Cryptobacteroides sp.]|nr:RecQ family ATP-dependent DNA helicase [Candidatus Cryptobacteroides sp.]